jgi:hypothetical protein
MTQLTAREELETMLYRHAWAGETARDLARDLDIPVRRVTAMIDAAARRDGAANGPAPRPRSARRRTRILSGFGRATDVFGSGATDRSRSADSPSAGPDERVHTRDTLEAPRSCLTFRRQFLRATLGQTYWRPWCRRLAHRLERGDPTAPAALRMLRDPSPCLGCGEPLWDRPADAKWHGDACRKRAARTGGRADEMARDRSEHLPAGADAVVVVPALCDAAGRLLDTVLEVDFDDQAVIYDGLADWYEPDEDEDLRADEREP